MKWILALLVQFASLFTGRAIWMELAATLAEKQGDKKQAVKLRNAAFWERMKK